LTSSHRAEKGNGRGGEKKPFLLPLISGTPRHEPDTLAPRGREKKKGRGHLISYLLSGFAIKRLQGGKKGEGKKKWALFHRLMSGPGDEHKRGEEKRKRSFARGRCQLPSNPSSLRRE